MKKHIFCHHTSEYDIQFFDVDSMDIMWHGHYVKYLEMARCAFLEEIHYTYDVMKKQGYAWPIVQLNVKYVRPALFRQKIRIELNLVEYESSLRIDYVIRDALSGKKLTTASTTQVAVEIASGEMQFQTPICWRSAVENHPSFKVEQR
ncbi:acyl-CoA thioesterase [Rodentibacter genomosp. 2]|uniref:Thioesterase n=1 Tax=Rodentibacter genomosp. 2 TaxID=1908266 RepID=A0A1V3JDW8_9PAST|nr:acyl-CoA thioesterase [Rodentibacter genomosp. 2]OOF54886.1 thioesterase [Rodentibacter genomosp. 2]OOF55479.1 thioesterase [Rodentibacter genomosp. 2]